MKVRIKGDVSGSRNGVPWPKRGEAMELPDDEGAQLCASGLATPLKDTEDDVETAVPDDDSEKRTGLTKENSGALTPDGDPGSQDGGPGDPEPQEQNPAPAAKKTAAPAKKTTAAAKKTAAPAKPQAESK